MGITAIGIGFLVYLYVVVPLLETYPLKFPYGDISLLVSIPLMLQMSGLLITVILFSSAIPTLQILNKPILKAISS